MRSALNVSICRPHLTFKVRYELLNLFEDSPEEQERFKKDPVALQTHGKEIERKLNGLFLAFYGGSDHQKKAIKFFYDQMKIKIKDPKLLKGEAPASRKDSEKILNQD